MNEAYFKPFLYRLKAHCQQGTTDKGDISFKSDVNLYQDLALYKREIDWLQSMPVAIGALKSLAKPGDYFIRDTLNLSLIATHSTQNTIQVLANICKHRAATLLTEISGNIHEIACPYHGWRYNLEGKLIHCSNQHLAAPNLKLNTISLTNYPSYQAAGLLWTQFTDYLSLDWNEFIAPLKGDFQALWQEDYKPIAQFSLLGEFNWKIAVESFLEIYHFAYAHHKSIPDIQNHNIALMDKLECHARIIIPMNSFTNQFADKLENDWVLLPHCNIMYYIFPCNFLLVMRGFYAWINIEPLSVDNTNIQLTVLAPEESDVNLIQRAELSAQGLKEILKEDILICNSLQKNIKTKNVTHFNYTQLEHLIEHFHIHLKLALEKYSSKSEMAMIKELRGRLTN